MQDLISYFKNKKNLINVLILAVLLTAIPLGVQLVRNQQVIKSFAREASVTFLPGVCVVTRGNNPVAICKDGITVSLVSPYGPPQTSTTQSAESTGEKLMSLLHQGGLVSEVSAGHDDGCGETESCAGGEYCDGDSYCTDDADGGHTCYPPEPGTCGVPEQVCEPGAFRTQCTGRCGEFAGTGEREVYQCRGDGSGEDFRYTESSSDCPGAAQCTGGGGTKYKCVTAANGTKGCQVSTDGTGTTQAACQTSCTTAGGACTGGNFTDKCGTNKSYSGACQELKGVGWNGTCSTASCSTIQTTYNNTVRCASPGASGGGGQGNLNMSLTSSSGVAGSQYTVDVTGSCGGGCELNVGLTAPPSGCSPQAQATLVQGCPNYIWRYVCTAPASGSVNVSAKNGCNGTITKTFTVTAPPVTTTHFKVALARADLAAAAWLPYTTDPMEHTFNFADTTRGQKSVWVQFKSSTNQESNPAEKKINFVGSDPVISGSVDCNLDTAGNVSFRIKGSNFGDSKGTSRVVANSGNLSVDDWKDTEITGKLGSNAATGKQKFDITLTREDGAPAVTQSCSLGVAQVSLGAKLFCQLPSKGSASNVNISLAESTSSGTISAQVAKEIVSIDTNGLIQGLKTKVQEGKKYKLAIKVPGGLRKQVEFTAASGTTVVPNVSLPVGDIYPAGGDGTINTLDKAELNRQWVAGVAATTGRTGDFNGDGKVNSIDWACMRQNFGQSDASDL